MKVKYLLRMWFIALTVLVLVFISLLHIRQASRAQGGLILNKLLNKSSPVVRVGEVVSFTITLNNNAGFVLTNVTLVDNYESSVMAFAGATPVGPDIHNPASGLIQWNNVAAPPIAIGEMLTFTLFFTVEHPETNPVVNRVEAQDIMGSNSSISNTQAMTQVNEANGNAAPLVKFLSPPGSLPQVGLPLTFTQVITNDGLALMTFLPLTDSYDPGVLEFNFAVPPPNVVSPGQLVWTDLTNDFGDLAPFETVVVTTVFTAVRRASNTVNEASTAGALDQFNNILAEGRAAAGIRIIGDEPVSPPDDGDDGDDDDDDEESAPASPLPGSPAATPEMVAPSDEPAVSSQGIFSDSNAPRYLPETGQLETHKVDILFWGVVSFISSWLLLTIIRGRKKL
jgi:uncharacterized repeat protein (TIGR01451 family)